MNVVSIFKSTEFLFPYNLIEFNNKSIFIIQNPSGNNIRVVFNVSPADLSYTLPILETTPNKLAFPQIIQGNSIDRIWVSKNVIQDVFLQQLVHSLEAIDVNYLPYQGLYFDNSMDNPSNLIKNAQEFGILLPSTKFFKGTPLQMNSLVEHMKQFYSEEIDQSYNTLVHMYVRYYYIKIQMLPDDILKILKYIYDYLGSLEVSECFYGPYDKNNVNSDNPIDFYTSTWMQVFHRK